MYQVSTKLYGCANDAGDPATVDSYTGYWNTDAHNLGTIISIDEAAQTPGAAILRLAIPGGLGGHIVISDGKGGTVEAHSSADGVINSVVSGRRWDLGILIPWIAYTQLAPIVVNPPATPIYRYANPMMTGATVKAIQTALTNAGFDPQGIDGEFGQNTANAVIAFQTAKGLIPDGEVGPSTAAALGVVL